MKLSDFRIGLEFTMSDRRYRCTDVGSRVAVAICLDDFPAEDPSWANGPPYAICEYVIDEDDLPECSIG